MSYRITRLGHLGDGITDAGHFAPFTLPEEEVSGTISGDRLENVRILTPSPERITPPCRHFKQCGGCQVQHASDDFVRNWKVGIVETALAARGIAANVTDVFTAPSGSRRRARLSARRTKKSAMVGFFRAGSDQLVEIPDCRVLAPEIMAALPILQEITRRFASRKGTLGFQLTVTQTGLDMDLSGVEITAPGDIADLVALVGQGAFARVTQAGEVIATLTRPRLDWGGIALVPVPGGFLQATPEAEAALVSFVDKATTGARRIVDLFAGVGTFSLPLVRRVGVAAFELDPDAIAAMQDAWRHATGVHHLQGRVRDLFRAPLDADELAKFDAAVIDPARAGAPAQMAELAKSDVPVIASISCNPVTFARDAKTLIEGGYNLENLHLVDQFRWSSHVELAARFTKGHMG